MAVQYSLEVADPSLDDDGRPRRTGHRRMVLCGLLQYLSLYVTAVAYVITVSNSMRAVHRANCYHKEGHKARCKSENGFYMVVFGAVQIFMSQIPDFHNMAWLSWLAAIMSFCYSSIGLGLGFAKIIGNGRISGGIAGVAAPTPARKVWTVFQALGDVAFSYPYSLILLEIQIFSQPIFATFELWFAKKFPNSGFICKFYTIRPPVLPSFHINVFRLFFRTMYVLSTTETGCG
ncbi:hypothetical protein SAY87_022163 [Trapa incisa]|uniref:Amino acid transporter transmembrane domain-containing protein n=1 Tax=Trapa incisa TaxID=236973 RepID=A0AAN7PXG7_9MYRT|nr:hypothetical protein SAY87_022163 [Trapa incisa]